MTRGGPRAAGRRWAILVVATATVLLVAAWLYDQMTWVTVDDARVATDMVAISSRVPGGVVSVRVISGDHAAKGQLLVELDGRDARLRIEELEARLAGMALRREELRARLRMIDMRTASKVRGQAAAVTQAQALLAGAQANEDLAQRDARRAEQLAPGGAIGRDQLDRARAALETARQQVRGSVANLETNRSSSAQAQAEREEVKVLARQLAQLDPEEAELRAQRERATLDLKERTVVMPFDGVVDRTFVHAGEYVVAGQRLLLAHDPRAVRVEANVKETDIRHFRPGKKVSVRVDALPGDRFEGTVQRVGQAATSEFALLPSPNPSGNFTKITQRLPVRISVARRDGALKPGMMVQVEANTRE
ncbi:HlyD family secretion protein [Ramlibacter sp. GTP1]|uniref:HlyD family secretion protein n=2 Tax=Ramlibacter albus TaxID=2079448 RepID=A0A923M2N1_9BURK|nr:HlyD family secretion protein [Ramlibacter albus]